ncbi:DUF2238 domain-containing protein [Thalassolituus sp. LLYu03]|uniref:DUF2238 domain-containing protein n=1 Tax=Thalassolituus sp. LLYu03 TaxID=3421656 RepID=UPI003D28150C
MVRLMLGAFALFFIAVSWQVADRTVWYAEVTPLVVIYLGLLSTLRWFEFSPVAYACMLLPLAWHTVGAHFTFSLVPMQWLMEPLGLTRNPYDRIGHFMVGFFAWPVMEFLLRRSLAGPVLAALFAVFAIGSVAAGYEIIEWLYADIEGGNAGVSFLGAQGDVWDAQKDMLADISGALLTALLAYPVLKRRCQTA